MSFSPSLKPQIKSTHVSGNTATIQLSVPPLKWFEGHFDEQPVLPGIALVLWAKAAFTEHFPVLISSDMPKVKFTRIICPGAELSLQLNLSKQLKFRYEATDGSLLCEGQFRYSMADNDSNAGAAS